MGSPFEGSPRAGAAEYVHKGCLQYKKAVPQKNSFFYAYILVLIRKRLGNSTDFYFLQATTARAATATNKNFFIVVCF